MILISMESVIMNRLLFRIFFLITWKIESHYQHHKFDKKSYKTIKSITNTIIYHTGDPDYTQIIYIMYMCLLLNRIYASEINGIQITKTRDSTEDIIPMFQFQFNQPVYYKADNSALKNISIGLVLHNMLAMTWLSS